MANTSPNAVSPPPSGSNQPTAATGISFTSKQIAYYLSVSRRAIELRAQRNQWPYTTRPGRGGQVRYYAYKDLPADIRGRLIKTQPVTPCSPAIESPISDQAGAFSIKKADDKWLKATNYQRKQATERAQLIKQVERLNATNNISTSKACKQVAQDNNISSRTLQRYINQVRGIESAQWPLALLTQFAGGASKKSIADQAWGWFAGEYLSRRQPTIKETYRRLQEVAKANNWGDIASEATFTRRIKAMPYEQIVYMRKGDVALNQVLPMQRRDKTCFTSGEAVNGDGLKFDKLYIRHPDGEITNKTTGWYWQDIRSGKILSCRVGKTENTDLFRLATYDLTGVCLPKHAWVDNTTVASNKAMTGRSRNRRRFKDQPHDPIGLLKQMDIEVHFTNPDQKQSNPGAKPVERAFASGGIHELVASAPEFSSRGYSTKTAIDLDDFMLVLKREISRFNARTGRRSAVCRGQLSLNDAWDEGLKNSVLRTCTATQRNLLLLMPEVARVDSRSGEIRLAAGRGQYGKTRWFGEAIAPYRGDQVIAYYDPEDLTKDSQITDINGQFIGTASRLSDTAFNDTTTAREWAKNKQRKVKSIKKAAKAISKMSELERNKHYQSIPDTQPGPTHLPVTAANFKQRRKVLDDGRLVDTVTGEVLQQLDTDFDDQFVDVMNRVKEAEG